MSGRWINSAGRLLKNVVGRSSVSPCRLGWPRPLRNVLAQFGYSAIIQPVNSKQRRTLEAIWVDPVNGNLEWARIESLLVALGCKTVEGPGSSVTFEYEGRRATFHRPHPRNEALRYRVKAVREFLQRMGVKP